MPKYKCPKCHKSYGVGGHFVLPDWILNGDPCPTCQAMRKPMSESNAVEKLKLELAVSLFRERMNKKLAKKVDEGYRGWNDMDCLNLLMDKLQSNVDRLVDGDYEQCVDIANLAMMIDHLYQSSKEKANE